MLKDFRKVRIGFANLQMLGIFKKEAEEEAVRLSDGAKSFLSKKLNVEVFSNLPAVTNLDQARETWIYFKEKNVDAVILFSGTFNLSNLMSEIIRNLDLPFLAWGLEEYLMDSRILAGSMIGLMPVGSVCRNLKKKFSFAYGSVKNNNAVKKVTEFVDVVRAISYLAQSRIGLIGSRPDGFEIAGFDELAIKRIFGATINKISMDYLLDKIDSVKESSIDEDMEIQKKIFDFNEKDYKDVRELSRVYLGVKEVIDENKFNCYAPQCWPELRMERRTPICPANGRLTAEGTMASCEADMDCAITMLALYALSDNTPWTADFVNLIEEKNSILFWHCGNASYNLSDKKPELEIVYEGLAQTASLRSGEATVCRINHIGDKFEIFAGVGKLINAEPVLRGSNSFIQMDCGNMEFVEAMLLQGVPHHNVLVYGNLASKLKTFANLVDVPIIVK
ncbi:MAG: L-arabinose isomerase family protein [Candidatus Humimicrobiaceae bacterium]